MAMEVIGYSYDADIYCVDCTLEYARTTPYSEYHWDRRPYLYDEDISDSPGILNMEKAIELEVIRDSENNPLHPIFDTDEAGDTPDHCGGCREYIDTSWHDSTIEYAIEALAHYAVHSDGNAEILDQWNEKLNWCGLTARNEAVRLYYDEIRLREGV